MSGHAFLAVDLTTHERHALAAALHDASPGPLVPGKRQPPENWHLTLRFLGETSDMAGELLVREVEEAIDLPAGRVSGVGLGVFSRPAKASVLYVRIDDPTDLLTRLAARCDAAAMDVGFPPEERPFVPHLTLSRLRPAQDLRGLLDAFGDFDVGIAVTAVTLFRTRRSRSRLWYEAIETIDLVGVGP
ncbi:MAG: RNA 2',3'-cyclic phosphodiesterase [Actinomycetia bacterium]|nr:RNA 2',3'-cyclic phosphodiesterase [Actinomycetes bacterium]